MNYIKQLQAENAQLKATINSTHNVIKDFSRLLHSSKHNGVDMHGERSDWIATSDALRQLELIHSALHDSDLIIHG